MKKKAVLLATVLTVIGMATGCGKQVKDMADYIQPVEGITIQDDVRIVALGEATHGNVEFQELKLDVFRHLVETTNVRGIALEGDFGGCAIANEYIQNNEGTAEEVVKLLGYRIYRTDQMLELVEWMHDYNMTAEEGDRVRLYGVDMQCDLFSLKLLCEYSDAIGEEELQSDCSQLQNYYGTEEDSYDSANLDAMEEVLNSLEMNLTENEAVYLEQTGEEAYSYAVRAVKCMIQNIGLHRSTTEYNQLRDQYMKENIDWILAREESIHQTRLMFSGHNGHVAKAVNSTYTNVGSYLYEELGSAYMVIGTDFYNTNCNIAETSGRGNHEFCSDDPLAEAVKDSTEVKNYLSFETAKESDELSKIIENEMSMGSLGEAYSPAMKFMKISYQINMIPEELYDGMIFVYDATPISVWESN